MISTKDIVSADILRELQRTAAVLSYEMIGQDSKKKAGQDDKIYENYHGVKDVSDKPDKIGTSELLFKGLNQFSHLYEPVVSTSGKQGVLKSFITRSDRDIIAGKNFTLKLLRKKK